jgi:hypothetical protein
MYQPILNENNVTKFVQLCAWCDGCKTVTREYIDKGWTASHGICKAHKDEVLKQYKKDYEEQGYVMGNDGIWIDPVDRMQHNSGSGI